MTRAKAMRAPIHAIARAPSPGRRVPGSTSAWCSLLRRREAGFHFLHPSRNEDELVVSLSMRDTKRYSALGRHA